MNAFTLFQAIFTSRLAPWLIILFIVLFVLRDRIKKLRDAFLDWLGTKFETEVGYRRFEPRYREIIRVNHFHLKIVGIRTEEERRPEIMDAYVPIKLVPRGSSLDQALVIEQIIRGTPYTLILGDPGAGKSTLLDYLTIQYTRPSTSTKSRLNLTSLLRPIVKRTLSPCPIHVSLRRCSPANRTLLEDILDPNTEILPQAVHAQMSKNFIQRSIERGRAVLLLDGLDEVASEVVYHNVIKKVKDFIQIYTNIKVIVTCRKVGWRGGLDSFKVFTALPLDAGQQHDFVHKWYAAILQYTQFGHSIEEKDRMKAEQEANNLLDLLRFKERLRELASNPLMLALICLVHRQRRNLPRGRAELYKDCLEILLGLWDRIDKDLYQNFPTTEEKMQLLRRMAFNMHNRGIKEESRQKLETLALQFLPDIVGVSIPPAEFVRQIEERSGLLVERSIDRLAFAHLTLQEFLVVEYCRVEQKEDMKLTAISDWSAWREPVLLMCGVITDPNPFLAQLFAIQPIIAIEGLAEAEPTRLDMHLAENMVGTFIERTKQGKIDTNQAIPALVNLLSMEKNPFGQKIMTYIYTLIQQLKAEEISRLVEALSKTPTRESARIILTLLTKFDLGTLPPHSEVVLLFGLTRIGDPAIEEALFWERGKELTESQFFRVLLETMTPFATKILWERYQLQPPPSWEVFWAKAWAIRLASRDNDQVVRCVPFQMPRSVSDTLVWPYRQNDKSVLATLVKKVVDILRNYYSAAYDEPGPRLNETQVIAKYALRVQIPLILTRRIPLNSTNLSFNTHQIIDSHSWDTLRIFLNKAGQIPKPAFLRLLSLFIGVGIEILSLLLVDWSITLWPPVGNFIGFLLSLPRFWTSLPLAGQSLLVLGVVFAILILLNIFTSNGDISLEFKGIEFGLFGIFITILFPMLPYFIVIWKNNSESIEKMLGLKKILWKPFLYVLGGSMLSGLAGFLILKSRIGILPGFICAVVIAGLVFLGIFMQERARAFQKNAMVEWLQKHPQGREVLDEFAMWHN